MRKNRAKTRTREEKGKLSFFFLLISKEMCNFVASLDYRVKKKRTHDRADSEKETKFIIYINLIFLPL